MLKSYNEGYDEKVRFSHLKNLSMLKSLALSLHN